MSSIGAIGYEGKLLPSRLRRATSLSEGGFENAPSGCQATCRWLVAPQRGRLTFAPLHEGGVSEADGGESLDSDVKEYLTTAIRRI